MTYIFSLLSILVFLPITFLAVMVHIPALLILIAIILLSWFYKVRILFWIPVCFGTLAFFLNLTERIFGNALPLYFIPMLEIVSYSYFAMMFLMPVLGLVISRIKNKKADKLFLYALLINFGLLLLIVIANPMNFIFAGV